jgi:hypothetical protein
MKLAGIFLTVLVVGLAAAALVGDRPASGQQPAATDLTNPNARPLAGGLLQLPSNGGDPELGKLWAEESKLEREASGLVSAYARTDDDGQRVKLKKKLADVLEKQFDQQQKRREAEVARVEAQVKKLRQLMSKRGEARESIISRRLDQLLREAEGLGWTPPPGGAQGLPPVTPLFPRAR